MQDFIDNKLFELENLNNSRKYWNISKSLRLELEILVKDKNPNNILEIGTSNGYSALAMAKVVKNTTKITTIEVDEGRFFEARGNFKDCNLKNIFQIKGEVFELIENSQIKGKFDLIFIDAAQRSYLNLVKKLIKIDILEESFSLIFDNVLSHKNMEEFILFMKNNFSVKIVEKDSGFLIATPI